MADSSGAGSSGVHGEVVFAAYYREQGIVPEVEWERFQEVLARPLPTTFKLHSMPSRERSAIQKRLIELGTTQPVAWAPAASGIWQAVAGAETTLASGSWHQELTSTLNEGIGAGVVNRQEAVSMLPVMALRVPVGSCCLDLCASPNFTMQLLEAVSGSPSAAAAVPGGLLAVAGLVVANDAQPRRSRALLEALGRHGRPARELARLAVTCHRGEAFPEPARPFRSHGPQQGGGGGAPPSRGFDRVLADLPSSADGSVRSDGGLLPRWSPARANALHASQLAQAWRGLQLLRVGGLLAYSVPSLNPVEGEAVVSALLRRAEAVAPGAVVLEEWPADVLPDLVRRPGLSSWGVAEVVTAAAARAGARAAVGGGDAEGGAGGDGDGEDGIEEEEEEEEEGGDRVAALRWHRSYADAAAAGMPHAVPTLWPPSSSAPAPAVYTVHATIEEPADAASGAGGHGHSGSGCASTAVAATPAEDATATATAVVASAASLHLERCSRVLPHDNDTGGGFVALLRKQLPLESAASAAASAAAAAAARSRPPPPKPVELDGVEILRLLPPQEADPAGAAIGLPQIAARWRLLSAPRDASRTVRVAPAALAAFEPRDVLVVGAAAMSKWSGMAALAVAPLATLGCASDDI